MKKYVLAIDVGSTTTKAILFGSKDGLRLINWAGAPTTVEKPHENVIVGVKNSVSMLEKKCGRKLLKDTSIITPATGNEGVDIFVATSSAGGGLQMLVTGVMKKMTAESAYKAALGAGAIVTDVLAVDDGRTDLERIQRIQRLRPDMVLISGGVDGGNEVHVVSMAELVAKAQPASRLGSRFRLPVVYAGNVEAREQVGNFLKEKAEVHYVDNLRPILERENLEPTGEKIQELFLEHVMSHAPGYEKLIEITGGNIMPTPNAVGDLLNTIGESKNVNILAVDIGGATTDVFSSMLIGHRMLNDGYADDGNVNKLEVRPDDVEYRRTFYRSVDANLGMSYSVGNILAESGGEKIIRWLPFSITENQLRNILSNKMIHPTILPQTKDALLIEHAAAREAIHLAYTRHKLMASGLSGVHIVRAITDAFNQDNVNEMSLIDDAEVDVIIGSGGVLSHTPNRNQALAIMLDAFQPVGVTELYVDSIFMMPHLGVMLKEVAKEEVFNVIKKDCLIPLGTCLSVAGPIASPGKAVAKVTIEYDGGKVEKHHIVAGELKRLPLEYDQEATVTIKPSLGYNAGDGTNRITKALITGGSGGIILDGRGRPIQVAKDPQQRIAQLKQWLTELSAYPESYMGV
ncbi:glutamate mutase L [Clostridium sp. 'deep sea']|uniref:glutamate mutase L n=1 Tax=Clostridium sp. 'deep sea' TaxID=2779445 RepID=UPI0018966D11|nr:glutamate mutase L [Clostridium sp. 'deep sea']QOR34132.1 glutamate mutase L [Clostridium sp. 'deep sea']